MLLCLLVVGTLVVVGVAWLAMAVGSLLAVGFVVLGVGGASLLLSWSENTH